MKKFIVSLVAVLALMGCTVSTDETPTQTQSSSVASDDATYLQVLRDRYPVLTGVDDDTLLTFAHNLCDAVDRGLTVDDLATLAQQNGLGARMAGFMAGAGMKVFCPESIPSFLHGNTA